MSISLCMIAKDEENSIGHALDSVEGLVDEIIVADTGSKDNTKQQAQQKGAKVIDIPWTDDFSKARNECIKHATKDWIFILDADEVINTEHHERIRQLMVQDKDALGFLFLQVNYANNAKISGWKPSTNQQKNKGNKGYFMSVIVRLFQNNKGVSFSGAVHEGVEQSIKNMGGAIKGTTIPIYNYGNADPEHHARKKQLYLEICKKKVQQEPTAQSWFQLGVLLKENSDVDNALKAQQEALNKDKKFYPAQEELGVLYELKKEYDKAIHHYEESAIIKARSEPFIGVGTCYLKKGELKKAFTNLKKAMVLNPNKARIYMNLGLIHEKNKQFQDAAKMYSLAAKLNPQHASAFLNLGNAYAKSSNFEKALGSYQKAIDLGHPKKDAIQARMNEVKEMNQKTTSISFTSDPSYDQVKKKKFQS